MRRRVLTLSGLHAAVAAALVLAGALRPLQASVPALVGFAAAFALVGLAPIHVELRRHACTVVLVDAVLVVALFSLGPAGVVLTATAGEALACLTSRQQRLKLLFNVTSTSSAVAVAASVFAALEHAGPAAPSSWLAASLAVACFAAANLASTAFVLAMAEHRRVAEVLVASAGAAMVASGASASLGLATVALLQADRLGPVLLVPLLAAVVLGTRRLALQSAEHLRFERLYQASSRSGGLVGLESTLATLAEEARGLVTGAAAVCCAEGPDGRLVGVVVDDDGPRPAAADAVDVLVRLSEGGEARAHHLGRLPRADRAVLPAGAGLLLASAVPGSKGQVVLAVVREIGADDQDAARVEVLSAFAGHAALAVANALLFAEVEEALRRQVDLNRQKDEFVAAVSHELRTPLTSVLASVSTVRRLGDRLPPARREQMFSTALEQGERLTRLIEELLLVAAAESGGMRADLVPVEVLPLVGGVVADLSPRADGRLSVEVAPGVGAVCTDEHKVRRILINLVDNAVKYAPTGLIEVRVDRVETAVRFSVTDHGPGIPASDRERVFERFVQLDQSSTRRQGGTGLGLYLCRQLAALLGGSLELGATPGGGCRIELAVPDASEPALTIDLKPEVARPDAFSGARTST